MLQNSSDGYMLSTVRDTSRADLYASPADFLLLSIANPCSFRADRESLSSVAGADAVSPRR